MEDARTTVAPRHAAVPRAWLAVGALVAATQLLAACGDMKPRAEKPAPQPDPATATAGADSRDPSKDPTPGDPNWKSGSALGKARDSAVQLKEKIAQHEAEVSKQADEVFKK